jgi:hypothetical protein
MEQIILKRGAHKSAEEGMCLLEAVAFVAGEPHSDHPACTDPVLGAFGRAVNDWLTDEERQRLAPLVPKLVGTAGDHTLSLRRAMLLTDAVVRQIVPIAFDACGLGEEATKLRELAQVQDGGSAESAESAARSASASAESAARSASASAAWSAWSASSAASSAAAWSAWSAS